MKRLLLTLLYLLCAGCWWSAFATHAAGGELVYTYQGNNTWKFTFRFYRYCASGTATSPNTVTMCYSNTCNNTSGSVVLNKITTLPNGSPNGTIVNTGCPTGTNCTNTGSIVPGFEEWWYENTLTLNNACVDYVFWCVVVARNNGQLNLANNNNLHVEAHLNNFDAPTNSSPDFSFKPIPYLCLNQLFSYNNGGYDQDVPGDSLVYSSIQPLTSNGTCGINTNASGATIAGSFTGYNPANNPFPTTVFGVNANTGLVQVQPSQQGQSTITILVTEYRNGVKIGSVMRDIQIAALPCQVVTPVSNLQANSLNNLNFNINTFHYDGCPLDTVKFCLQITGAVDTALLVASSNSPLILPGSTLTISGTGTDTLDICLKWLPGATDTGLHVVTIQYRDTNCLYNNVSTPASFSLPIYIVPSVVAYPDTVICQGDTITLRATGGTSFIWNTLPLGSPNSTIANIFSQSTKVWPSTTTSYQVESNLGNLTCGDNKDTVTVVVIPRPTVNLGPNLTTCFNSSVQITPVITPTNYPFNYSWSPGTFLTNPLNTPNQTVLNPTAASTSYTLSVYSSALGPNVCVARDTIVVNSLLGAQVFNNDTMICQGQTVQVVGIGSSQYTYSWSPTTNVSNPSILNPTITQAGTSGTINYTMTASYPNCPNISDNFSITIQPNPIVNAGPNYTLCFGDTLHLSASVLPSNGVFTYAWSPAADLDNPNSLTPVFDGLTSQVLTLLVTSSIGCTGSDQVAIDVVPVDFLQITPATAALCPGQTAQFTASGGVTYYWSPGHMVSDSLKASITAYPISSTVFTVISTDINGCLDTVYRTVTIYENAQINLADEFTIYPGESATLYASGNCNTFSWAPSNGLSATNVMDPIAQPNVSTQYIVQGSTENGCTTADTVIVNVVGQSVLALPNAFTPGNGSGINDRFAVDKLGLAKLTYFRIFDRWGQMVFETNDINQGWDGNFKGKPQPIGTYIYMVDGVTIEGKRYTKTGNVTLLR